MRKNKIANILIKLILPITSVLMVFMSIVIEVLTKKSMGVYRDILFRNRILEESILTNNLINLYKIFISLGVITCILILILKRIQKISRNNIILLIILQLIALFMLIFYNKINLIALPIIICSIIYAIIIQLIKTIAVK